MMKKNDDPELLEIMDQLIERDYSRAEIQQARREYRKKQRERRVQTNLRFKELLETEFPQLFKWIANDESTKPSV